MMRLSCLIAVIALAACPGSKSSPATTETKPVAAADDRCPMTLDGTSVAVEDTATGGALVFVTTGDLDALRLRLRGWATRHSQRHEAMGPLPTGDEVATGGHDHHHHGGGGTDAASIRRSSDPADWIAAHSSSEITDVDQSVRLTFVTFPDQVASLQAELRAHAEHLGTNDCAPSGAP